MNQCIDCGKQISRKSERCHSCAAFLMWENASPERRQAMRQQSGSKNPMWKGGRRLGGFGVAIWAPNNPMADCAGYVLEHRLVMARHIDRPLGRQEVVHHINGNNLDNRIKNLILFPSQAAHISHHANGRLRDSVGRFL